MSAEVVTTAGVTIALHTMDPKDGKHLTVTLQDVRDWLAEVERLHIPDDTPLEDCVLSIYYTSQIVDAIEGESELGVHGWDLLVGLPR